VFPPIEPFSTESLSTRRPLSENWPSQSVTLLVYNDIIQHQWPNYPMHATVVGCEGHTALFGRNPDFSFFLPFFLSGRQGAVLSFFLSSRGKPRLFFDPHINLFARIMKLVKTGYICGLGLSSSSLSNCQETLQPSPIVPHPLSMPKLD